MAQIFPLVGLVFWLESDNLRLAFWKKMAGIFLMMLIAGLSIFHVLKRGPDIDMTRLVGYLGENYPSKYLLVITYEPRLYIDLETLAPSRDFVPFLRFDWMNGLIGENNLKETVFVSILKEGDGDQDKMFDYKYREKFENEYLLVEVDRQIFHKYELVVYKSDKK